jgi:hypothetical protein
MKIDKIIFTSSEEYSGYWNLNSKVCKEFLGIEPVCFLFGKKKNTDMNEKYGEVIEKEFVPTLPKLLQITWYKFFHTMSEPETTWMIGDIDQIPLQRKLFIDDIQNIPDNHYVHLNYAYIPQMSNGKPDDAWMIMGGNIRNGADLAGHHHVAKGKVFEKCLQFRSSVEEDIEYIVKENKYGLGITEPGWNKDDPEKLYWCAEENYSSEILFNTIIEERLNPFTGLYYNLSKDTIDRWRMVNNNYLYNLEKLKTHSYVNIHCARDYKAQEESLINILKIANII